MQRRLWLSIASAAVGAGLLLAAGFASPAASGTPQSASGVAAKGGTLRVASTSDFDFIDPSLAYFSHTFGQLLDATCAKLYSYADKEGNAGVRPRPEVALGFPKVSNNGRTYTITLRKNYARFHTGEAITARSFANAMNRNLDPDMQSPATIYMEEIVGAKAVIAKKAQRASGIVVRGNKLILRTTVPVPDMTGRLTMSFFCPQPGPNGLPRNAQGIDAPYSGGGPYYISEWTKRRTATMERNPYWRGPIAKTRPANVDRIVWTFGVSPAAAKLQLDKNETDLGPIPPTAVAELAQQHGINKGRLFLRKQMVLWYLAMNHDRPMFGGSGLGNVGLKKAVNHAIDRPSLVRQFGYLAGARTDQVIPYTMPGFRNWDIYSLRGSNVQRAQQLAEGKKRDGKIVFYTFNTGTGLTVPQVVQANLRPLGIEVEVRQFDRVVQHDKAGTRGEPFDMTFEGWGADYADPVTFIQPLLWGGGIQASNNVNESYFNNAAYNRKIVAAARVGGAKRDANYARLDRDIMRNASPMAPFINTNARIYVGEDLGCYTYAPAHGVTNLVAVCKK